MNGVKAGNTEALQRFEAVLTVQHLLKGGKDWYQQINRSAHASGYEVHAVILAIFP
jgi:hypothetical protein